MNKSRVMKRAWTAYKNKQEKGKKGTFASCLKWSWKVEKEENSETLKQWSPKENFYRFYNKEGGYVQVSVTERSPRGYYECHRYSKGDKSDLRTGWYKLVNFTQEAFESFKLTIECATMSTLVASKF